MDPRDDFCPVCGGAHDTPPGSETCDPVGRAIGERFVHLAPARPRGAIPRFTVRDPDTGERVTLRAWPQARTGAGIAWVAVARAAIAPAMWVRHPHVVSISGVGLTPDWIGYLEMEAVDGALLRELPVPADGMATWRVAEIVRQAAEGLAAVHAAGLVHGALTPDSLVIEGGPPRVRLLDLGLSALRTAVDPAAGGPPEVAFTGPEVLAGASPTPASDIYSLAAIARAMLAGASAATDRTAGGRTPAGVEAVLATALAPEPARRFATVTDFSDALGQVVDPDPVPKPQAPATPVPRSEPAAPERRRSETRYATLALAAIAAVTLVAVITTWTSRREPAADARLNEEVARAPSVEEPEPEDSSDANEVSATVPDVRRAEPPGPGVTDTRPRLLPGQTAGGPDLEPETPSPVGDAATPAGPAPAARGYEAAAPAPDAPSGADSAPPVADLTPSLADGTPPVVDSTPLLQPRPTAPRRPPRSPTPPAGAGAAEAALAQAAAAQAVGRLAIAVESRDLVALGHALPQLTPDERAGWAQLFEVARELRAELTVGDVEVRGTHAEARVMGAYEFWNRSLNRRERAPVAVQATLVKESGGWRVREMR